MVTMYKHQILQGLNKFVSCCNISSINVVSANELNSVLDVKNYPSLICVNTSPKLPGEHWVSKKL